MKFVCENCKAKYQIGDDKVSGKTVRMKCRRCGHLILVSATVTESSVAKHAPAEGAPLGSSMGAQPTPPPGALQTPTPGEALVDDDDEGASTVIMSAPAALRMAPKPAAPGTPVAPGAPRPGQPPQAGGTQAMPAAAAQPPKAPAGAIAPAPPVRPAPPKPSLPGRPGAVSPFVPAAAPSAPSVADLAQRSMSSAISAAARGTSNPVGPGRAGAVTRGHLALAPSPAPTPDAASHLAPVPPPAGATPGASLQGGVAGAFQRVAGAPAPAALRVETPGEDWYVGVGGVPIGPVRLSVIREKVEQGAVDGESLVWREGFEEWQPLRNVPGLRAILDEPRRSTPAEGPSGKISSSSLPRVSLGANGHGASPAFGGVPTAAPSHASVAPSASSPPAEPTGPAALSSLVSTGGVSLGPAASADAPNAAASSPAALPPPAVDPVASTGLGTAAPAPLPVSIAPTPNSLPPPAREDRRKGMHPFAYAMIAMAAVFGGVAAWVLLIKAPPEPTVIVKTVIADPGLNSAPPPPPTEKADEAPAPSTSVDAKSPGGPIAQGGPRASSAPTTKPGEPPPPNMDSFGSGPGGPTTGPTTPDNGGGNGKLSEGEIQGVVSRNQSRVRRQCWQPALDASSGSGPKSARVSTTITIGPGGNVTNVNASGAENFPGLASCVGGAIRGWSFPKSEGSTTVNVPFSFNAQ